MEDSKTHSHSLSSLHQPIHPVEPPVDLNEYFIRSCVYIGSTIYYTLNIKCNCVCDVWTAEALW